MIIVNYRGKGLFYIFLKELFLAICSKISIYRGKGCFLNIIFQKSFLPISLKISTFEEKDVFLITLKKSFLSTFLKIFTYRFHEVMLKKSFLSHIFENINISMYRAFLKISAFQRKERYFEIQFRFEKKEF